MKQLIEAGVLDESHKNMKLETAEDIARMYKHSYLDD